MKALVYPEAYRQFDARDHGWTKVVLTLAA